MCREIVSFVERAWLTVPSIPFSSELPAKTLGAWLATSWFCRWLMGRSFPWLVVLRRQFRKCVPHCPLNERWLKTLKWMPFIWKSECWELPACAKRFQIQLTESGMPSHWRKRKSLGVFSLEPHSISAVFFQDTGLLCSILVAASHSSHSMNCLHLHTV